MKRAQFHWRPKQEDLDYMEQVAEQDEESLNSLLNMLARAMRESGCKSLIAVVLEIPEIAEQLAPKP